MKSKADIRKQLEEGMAVFLGNGGKITKCEAKKPFTPRKYEPKEKVVEIEVEHLPKALQDKYFAE